MATQGNAYAKFQKKSETLEKSDIEQLPVKKYFYGYFQEWQLKHFKPKNYSKKKLTRKLKKWKVMTS